MGMHPRILNSPLSFSYSNLGEIITFPKIHWLILNHAHANIFWSSVTLINEVTDRGLMETEEDGTKVVATRC